MPEPNLNHDIVHPDQESNANDPKIINEFWGEEVNITGNENLEGGAPPPPKVDESNVPNKGKDQPAQDVIPPVGDDKDQQPPGKESTKPPADANAKELNDKIAGLEVALAESKSVVANLQTQLQSQQQVANFIKEVGLDNKDQNEQAYLVKQMKRIAEDMVNVPMFTTYLKKFYEGEFAVDPADEKGIEAFMPEGQVYLESEGYQPGTASFKARKAFLDHEDKIRSKKQQFMATLEQERQKAAPVNQIPEGFAKAVKQLLDQFNKTKLELANVYPVTEDGWNKFVEFYRSGDADIIKSAFGVFAQRNNIQSKVAQKVEANKEKAESITNSKTKVANIVGKNSFGIETEVDEEQGKRYEELFGEKLTE